MNIIEVNGLVKRFGDVTAVNGIAFSVSEGGFFGFLGVNGAGKSTTINMLATLIKPTSGEAAICGHALGREDAAIRRDIGVVWQQNCLDKFLTVRENLMCRGALFEPDKAKREANLRGLSELLSLDELLPRRYGKLSGGQKRRCEIAAALMHSPRLLFLDEPTTGLDPATRGQVWEAIAGLRERFGTTVFLTTHYMEEAAVSDRIVIIDRGSIIANGTPFELKEQYSHDRLKLYADDRAQLTHALDALGRQYTEDDSCVCLLLSDTMDALDIMERIRGCVSGFEVIQGTMDDVFINACAEHK